MSAVFVVVVAFVAAVDPVAVGDVVDADGRCGSLRALVAGPASIEALAQGAPLVGGALGERLSTEAGRASIEGAWALLVTATALRCPVVDGADGVDIAALAADPRFSGARNDEDVGDQLLDRVFAWLQALLESDAMVAFSDQTRTVYLTGLAIVAVVVAWRLRRRRLPSTANDDSVGVLVERRRALAFSGLRERAIDVLDREPRAAMILLRQALLARIGEVDADAARPSRTASEVLARVSTTTAAAVAPALSHFDARFYAGLVDAEGARVLLQLVDDGVAALDAQGRRR